MADEKQKYCIDSSSLIELRALDTDVFGGIWDALGQMVTEGILHAPREVLREVTKVDDTTAQWAKGRRDMFLEPDQEWVDKVTDVQAEFKFFDEESEAPKADPFLVAHGILHGCTIITQEKPAADVKSKAKIPNACERYGVRVLTLSEFFREQGWTFIAKRSS